MYIKSMLLSYQSTCTVSLTSFSRQGKVVEETMASFSFAGVNAAGLTICLSLSLGAPNDNFWKISVRN